MAGTGPMIPGYKPKYKLPPGATRDAAKTIVTGATNVFRNVIPPHLPGPNPGNKPASPKPPAKPGVLSGPGHYEKWFETSGKAPPIERYDPTNATGAYNNMRGAFSTPGAGATNARGISGRLLNDTEGENTMRGARSFFEGPNLARNYADDTRKFFGTQGQGATGAYGIAGGPTAAEDNLGYVDEALSGINFARDANAQGGQVLRGNTRTRDFFDTDVLDASRRNTVGDEYGFFAEGLRGPSYSEDLYESGNEGLNTFYDRERDKRTRALEDKMASMGVFGSGATGRALYELEGELGASQARDMADLAGQADSARLARTGEARAFSGAAGQEGIARTDLGIRGATASDDQMRDNALAMMTLAQGAGEEAFGKVDRRTSAAKNASDATLSRGRLGLEADDSNLRRVLGGSTVARSGDDSYFNQGRGMFDVGKGMSETELDRLRMSGDLGLDADDRDFERISKLFDSGLDLDKFGSGLTKDFNDETFRRWGAEGDAANEAQNKFETRERYGINDKMRLAQAKADLESRIREIATSDGRDLSLAEIRAMVQEAGITGQEAENMIDEWMAGGELAIKGREAMK